MLQSGRRRPGPCRSAMCAGSAFSCTLCRCRILCSTEHLRTVRVFNDSFVFIAISKEHIMDAYKCPIYWVVHFYRCRILCSTEHLRTIRVFNDSFVFIAISKEHVMDAYKCPKYWVAHYKHNEHATTVLRILIHVLNRTEKHSMMCLS